MITESLPITETIKTQSGLSLRVVKRVGEGLSDVLMSAPTSRPCVLHWGVRQASQAEWQIPPQSVWPVGTTVYRQKALQTPFSGHNGERHVNIQLNSQLAYVYLDFVLFFPEENLWDNNGGHNYQVALPREELAQVAPAAALATELAGENVLLERVLNVEAGAQLAWAVCAGSQVCHLRLVTNLSGPLWLHWGLACRSPHEWLLPPESIRPAGTVLWQGHTAETPFAYDRGLQRLRMELPATNLPLGIQFVLRQAEPLRWINQRGGNFYAPLQVAPGRAESLDLGLLGELAGEISRAEMGKSSWTLMHRFNLCHDLLDRARGHAEGLALLYAWLRFSAIRQLTWQRNYNTKPRELSHAQERLTHKLAQFHEGDAACRFWTRLMLATVGRGGEGQRVRDEILNIMHRHHIKEVSGHFFEEWHQKLHNNTTPDDVVICEAMLEFLRSNGDRDRFYAVLAQGGVSRQRLESFERPIRSHPNFVPHLKDGLIHDFQNFLRTLKAVHSGTDLETAIQVARPFLDGYLQERLGYLWDHRNNVPAELVPISERLTEVRRRLSEQLPDSVGRRELLYLDLALEQWLRTQVERSLHLHLSGDQRFDLILGVLENVTLSHEDPELALCLRNGERLKGLARFSEDWSLRTKAIADRISRALGNWIDSIYRVLQPKAECLGHAFQAEPWSISLFSEEVVRGSSGGFVLGQLLRQIEPLLRQSANIGRWQIISRNAARGRVEVVEQLRSIQKWRFPEPTIVIADRVMGDEEIPEGITAVIAPDVTDVVSHVAVRARNARLLFATCHDSSVLERLKAQAGKTLALQVTPGGDVVFESAQLDSPAPAAPEKRVMTRRAAQPSESWVLKADDFRDEWVGGKSWRQAQLRGKLPGWISQPAAVALPFGVMERVLALPENGQAAGRYQELLTSPDLTQGPVLESLRETIQSLQIPAALTTALREAMLASGMPDAAQKDEVEKGIKQVWASMWNDRACLSRIRMGLAHADLRMAVLVQPLIEANYAFVIHTVNPSNNNPDELYAEVVLGLGETLVGNYPGRAMGFVWDKSRQQLRIVSYPNKSCGLFGTGLIFRSDSNGEDLAGYAGAGLYESIVSPAPRSVLLDYADERLVWDEGYRTELLTQIAQFGLAIEAALGAPQDIEGAVAHDKLYLLQTRPQMGAEHA
jgi:alpha-glucan, water dikinase